MFFHPWNDEVSYKKLQQIDEFKEITIKSNEVDKDNIVIMGYSIGTGVASYCASTNEANGLILLAPYDNALSLYNDAIDIFHGLLKKITKYSFDSATQWIFFEK